MYDVDVLVRRHDVRRALEVVGDLGFRPYGTRPLDLQLRSRYGIGLHNDAGRELDLHWYATFQSAGDDDFWSASLPVEIGGVPTRVLCAADQLLHVCVHGLSGASPAPLRWITDALTVIRSSEDELDWDRLVARARSRECTVTLADGLSFLEREFEPGIPVRVIEQLRAAPASLAERWAHRVVARGQRHGAFYALNWHRYRRLRAARAPGVQPNFLAYLCDCWDVNGYRELGRLVARKVVAVARHGQSVAAELGPDEVKKPSQVPNGAARV
jgi:putative nucleotidyltransferase-like protein